MNPQKDTIYIDIDDDITGIIDRVVSSKNPIAALVLPKRAGVLHSSVNMRLLKRAAENAKKSIVLITTEDSLIKLAAITRVHVAKSLTTKPEMPEKPKDEQLETIVSEADVPKVDPNKSIGELAGDKSGDEKSKISDKDDDTIELDNVEDEKKDDSDKKDLPKKNKKLKVPSFDKFRAKIFIFGTLGLALIVFIFFAMFVWPKATITVTTETTNVDTKLEFSVNIAQVTLDEEKKILPSEQKELKTTLAEKFTATGQKDLGNKATGKMNVTNCINDGAEHAVPAGTSFTSNGFTFISTEAVTLDPAIFSGSNCRSDDFGLDKDVNVVAANGGDSYNLSARSYTASISGIEAYGTAMSGGTTKVVKVVSDADVEAAKQKIIAKSTEEYKLQLADQFKAVAKLGLSETFTATPGDLISSPKVGEEAGEATLTYAFTYQMMGVNPNDLDKLLTKVEEEKIDKVNQTIYNTGLDSAKIGQLERPSAGEAKMSLTTTATAGPQLDANAIAKEVAGKSAGETKKIILARTGISSVDVSYDPFWVLKTPKKVSRITIIFDAQD